MVLAALVLLRLPTGCSAGDEVITDGGGDTRPRDATVDARAEVDATSPADLADAAAPPIADGPAVADGSALDVHVADGESVDGQPLDGQPLDGQPLDGQPLDGQPLDGQPPDAGPPMPPVPAASPPAGLQPSSSSPGAPCSGPTVGGAAVICVDGNSISGGEQGTAAAPFRTIGAAILAAKDGDTVQIAGGTYPEPVVVDNMALELLGGFDSGFASRAPAVEVTTIVGDASSPALALIDAGASLVDGLRLTGGGGYTIITGDRGGGGIYLTGGTPTIQHCLIEANVIATLGDASSAANTGGGILADSADATIRHNVCRDNVAGVGGGVTVFDGAVLLENNDIVNNRAVADHGGGIYAATPALKVFGNRITGNKVSDPAGGGYGGGIIVFEAKSVAELRGNVFSGNTAPLGGSGVFIDDGATASLRNDLIADNACSTEGGSGLLVDPLDELVGTTVTADHVTIAGHACAGKSSAVAVLGPASLTLSNSVLWGNGGVDAWLLDSPDVVVRYSITEQVFAGPGNATQPPLFADAAGGDYHLRSQRGRLDPQANGGLGAWVADPSHSPAIDAADPGGGAGAEPQPSGGRANLGCYGSTAAASLSLSPP